MFNELFCKQISYMREFIVTSKSTYNIILLFTLRIKYIMLLKLPIILSRNSFNFYLLFPKLFPTFYYKSMQMCYNNHNILLIKHKHTIITLISHLMYIKAFSHTCCHGYKQHLIVGLRLWKLKLAS